MSVADLAADAVRVRLASREDMPVVHNMIHELAEFEGVPNGPKLTVEDLVRDGFECSPPWFFVFLAEIGGEAVGQALCSRAYSSWSRRALYVEDLWVKPAWRRRGIGRVLLAHVCAVAKAESAGRVDWHVLRDNAPALAFYKGLGARDLAETENRAALRLDAPGALLLAAELDERAAEVIAPVLSQDIQR